MLDCDSCISGTRIRQGDGLIGVGRWHRGHKAYHSPKHSVVLFLSLSKTTFDNHNWADAHKQNKLRIEKPRHT